MIFRNLILFFSRQSWMENLVRKGKPFRKLVNRFIAGDTLEEALAASEKLCAEGFFVTLDYLGENTKSKEEALAAKASYITMLEKINASEYKRSINISIKLTQCGLDQGKDFAEENYREVLTKADGNFVRIDMEGSDYTQATIDMILKVWPDHKNTGTVLQSYLKRTEADIETMVENQIRTRIVKGAYLEPPEVAFQEKSKVDEMYVKAAKRLLEAGNYPAIATHDPKIIEEIKRFAAEKNISKDKFEFQMLYGIGRDLQASLLAEGYNVRVYVPFGDAWYPYFSRRLAERPANVMFILKSMFKG